MLPDQGELLENAGRYRRLVGKLTCLKVTRPDITLAISVASQFLSAPRITHLQVVMMIFKVSEKAPGRRLLYSGHGHSVADFSDVYWTGYPFDMRLTTEYCVFL